MPKASLPVSKAALLAVALVAGSCAGPSRPSEEVAPSPSPAPTPEPTGCGAPPGTFNENCSRDTPTFYGEVDNAIEHLLASQPDMFDFRRARGCGRCFLVRDPEAFTEALVAELEAARLCAFYDGEELAVKATNDFNDQFDVLTFELFLRRENGSYRSTCRPAWF
jgi:hypothetical protein